jgi:hypothetical protein
MVPVYKADDQPGNDYQCSCVPRRLPHPFCENCLILIGPSHTEGLRQAALLPEHADHFDEERGVWERGMKLVPKFVCATCHTDIARDPRYATARIVAKTRRALRVARDTLWREQHPHVQPATRPGEFLRLGRFTL